MRMREAERWHCMDANCGCQIIVSVGANIEGRHSPRCCCGTAMKKTYSSPMIRVIETVGEIEAIPGKISTVRR